ncbi:family S53 protease-like protein [Cordyceps fumosorosea ARSEF 2679]|uniref:tripeptidyl-peptidase II n=1 Tax=Cordyceps fumosorosea (strain ARSEF 2679) TaxID=1081104 RepID=A0A167R4V9_CORFA|nr:family S53 protease-like protein [Cordyceps fumosorosea ARSEF 2679]OAA58273.1 family S53 protease-like protein [Cordyceps fumosorosea ARSEF 2679]
MVSQLFRCTIAACLIALCYGGPATPQQAAKLGNPALLEKVKVPAEWAEAGAPKSEAMVTLQIGLKQADMGGLQKRLMDAAHPSSPNYGKWLSKEEMEKYTSPAPQSVDMVKVWLGAHSIFDQSISRPTPDWMEVRVPIRQAETLLNSRYSLFKDSVTGKTMPRTTEYSIPSLLHDHIDTIQPTTSFHRSLGAQPSANATESADVHRRATCDPNNITPACIRSYYNVDYTSKGKASLAVTGFIGYSASHSDASSFLSQYDSGNSGSNFKDGSVGGAQNNPSNPTLEGNLDTQVALSLGHPNPVTYLAVGPNNDPDNQFGDELVNLGTYLNAQSAPPTAVSTSYGGEENGFSSQYLDRICNEFMKAGSRGVSVFFSSGDFGVGGNNQASCSQGFYALFPASCPYVTAVGATQFYNGAEYAAHFEKNGSTGGGFSWYFNAPAYQSKDTQGYIGNNLDSSYNGYYNANGRGYPDISLIGEYYDIVLNGGTERVYGTSASSPAWAALVSLINDYRISIGKSTLGFLNPLLYGNSAVRSALIDITNGNNRGCGTDGFPAAAGWDPTTGLGTMNFAKLRKALSS